jgi:O-antigen ligase
MCVTVLIVMPYSVMDPMNLPKMTVLTIGGFLALSFAVSSPKSLVSKQHRYLLLLTVSFQLLLLLNLVFSGRSIVENFYGINGRNTGVLTYLALSTLMFASSLASTSQFVKTFRGFFFAIGVLLFLYGLIQFVGLEPFPYVNAYANNVFGTFGNPNFQSAFMGILGTVAFVTLFDDELSVKVRASISGIFLASFFGIYSTNSWQGFFNLFAGIATGLILIMFKWKRYKTTSLLLSGSILAGVMVGLGIFAQGPLAELIGKASLEARRLYWEAAVQIMKSNPVFGVGFDGFGDWYRRGRSQDAALNNGGLLSSSAHNVALDIGVGGGLPVLIIYLCLIVLALWKIVQNLKSTQGMTVSYISICSAWVSYQAQSLISINQIGLGIIGWILLGLVIGYVPGNETNSSQKFPLKSKLAESSFASFISPIIALIIGLIIALPPYIAASSFYSSLKTSDIKVLQAAALQSPVDSQRMLIAAQVLENNKFYQESVEIVRKVNTQFPDSFEAWRYLSTLTNSTADDKKEALEQMRRLDPTYGQ